MDIALYSVTEFKIKKKNIRGGTMKRIISILLALVMMLSLVACGGGDTSTSSESTSTTEASSESTTETQEETSEAMPQEIIVALQSDGSTLDPHIASDAASMRLIENMYSTLVRYVDGQYGSIENDLASDYTISDDGLVYTFTINENATFHASGRSVTAEDVKYSIERIISSEVRASQFADVASIEVADELTVVITLTQPVAPFLTYLAYPMNAIVDKDVVDSTGLDTADGGSGPFTLVSWDKDQQLVMAKYDAYYVDGLPKLDKVTYKPIPDETARVIALQNGEIDLILDITNKDRLQLENAENVTIAAVPGTFWEYLGINVEKEPLNNVKVRQAIANAIDRQAINDVVKFGAASVLDGGLIPQGHWAYADLHLYPEQDLEKAQALLDEAGYGDGMTLELKVGADFQYQVDAAQMIKQQLAKVGIEVEVLAQESGIFFDALGKHDFQLTVVGWLGFVDPDEFLYNIFYTDAVWNQQGYSNSELDALLDEGRVETDVEVRKAIYARAQEIISDEAPMAFLYMNESASAYQDYVKDFDVDAVVTTLSLRKTYIEE